MKDMVGTWSRIALAILLVASLFVRLYHIADTQTFLEDEGRDMLIAKRMLDTKRPVLLGPQTSIGNMYLGPFYYYFVTPALALSGMDPVGPAVLVAFTGMLTVYVIFMMTRKWLGVKSAWVAAILYAFMPLPVAFTRNSWNPNLAPLVALLCLYCVDNLRHPDNKNIKWFGVLGVLTGILVQLHYMALVYIGLYCLILVVWWRRHLITLAKGIGVGILGFCLAVSPFIIFEIRNDWVNTRAIVTFIEAREAPNIRYQLPLSLWWSKVSNVTTSVFGGLFSRGMYRPSDIWTGRITLMTLALAAVGIFLSSLDSRRKWLLFLTIFGSIGMLGIYQENIHVHYLGFLFAITYVGFSSFMSYRGTRISYTFMIVAVLLLAYSVPIMWGNINGSPSNQVVRAREVALYIGNRAGTTPYNIVSSPKTSTTPYQYFSFLNVNKPSNDWTEKVFMICQGEPCTEAELASKQIFLVGPAHPSLGNYVGHPLANYVMQDVEVISNDHVSNGVWVAELKLINK